MALKKNKIKSPKLNINVGANGDLLSVEGNTKIPQRSQSCYWCFTWFNYSLEIMEQVESIFRHETDWYVFQEEKCPDTNKQHIQGTMKFKKRKRITELKKLIDISIHWEITKNIKGSVVYCSKQKTRCGKQWIYNINIPEPIVTQAPYGWQLKIMELIKQEPDPRKIHWYYEKNGCKGKSSLAKYLAVHHDALVVQGSSKDIFYAIKTNPNKRKIIIIDIPRTSLEFINYQAIESIKNGLIFSSKYESSQIIFNSPHVIIFANEMPDYSKLSYDRWDVNNIDLLIQNS